MAQGEVQQQVEDIVQKYNEELLQLEETHFEKMMDARIEESDCNILSPFLPSSAEHIQQLRDLADIRAEDVVLDIGCGDGRVLIALAKAVGCTGIGLDVSEECVDFARKMSETEAVNSLVQFHVADATQPIESLAGLGLEAVSVVYLFVYPTLLEKLVPLMQHFKTKVVTCTYHFNDAVSCDVSHRSPDGKLCVYQF